MYEKKWGINLFGLLAIIFLIGASPKPINKPVKPHLPDLYFSKIPTGRLSTKKFSCKEDTVYAFLRLPKKIYGRHSFWFYWIRPDGKLQDSSKLYVPPKAPGQRHYPAYLTFHVPDSDVVDIFFASGDDPGEEFSGLWKVKAVFDGKTVLSGSFQVVCP
jgi:hypothetical protein